MTTITYHSPSLTLPASPQSLTRILQSVTLWLQRRRTERMLESMPMELRKDIGWPTTDIAAPHA